MRFLLWFVAPFDERIQGLSMARLLAIWCFILVTHNVVKEERPLTGWDYATLLLGAALWVGKKAVMALIARQQTKASQLDQKIDVTLKEIRERRDQGREWDAEAS